MWRCVAGWVATKSKAASLPANDTDVDLDTLSVTGVSNPANGTVSFDTVAKTVTFTPNANFNGAAGFDYTISDGRGGTSTAHVAITVMPRNEAPILRNDLVSGLEDGPLFVIPAEAFGNDIEPDGDVLFFKRAGVLGVVDHRYLSAGFQVDAAMAVSVA